MKSCEALPAVLLQPAGPVTAAFVATGITDFRSAARYVRDLAYGRNRDRADSLAVLREHCGTCSTKHALLARLADEQSLPLDLMIGIYEMNERNTPGVGAVLARHGLASVPEAHCYLRYARQRIDITRGVSGIDPIAGFMHEEIISPTQIGEYKTALHQHFIREWIARSATYGLANFDKIWQAREECIAALSA